MQTSTLQQHPKKEQADKAKIVYSEHQKKNLFKQHPNIDALQST